MSVKLHGIKIQARLAAVTSDEPTDVVEDQHQERIAQWYEDAKADNWRSERFAN